ncbi:UDP-glucose 4-epimerase family protein [Caballeronia sp. 15711]|uniref:UDP-glucose 4-epimerase family protein n=1 Tax=Caballeronia sp. 15711 TaxID=3391029 RepID=UPI0039E704E0
MRARIAITGANGFVGRALSRLLLTQDFEVVGIVRSNAVCEPRVVIRTLDSLSMASPDAFAGCAAVVHLAARVHVMHDNAIDPLAAFREVNVDGALQVAQAALSAGVPRFVFVSSIKALADSDGGHPLRETDARHPLDPYGESKAEAEIALQEFGMRTGLEVVILRPPLVYGPDVRANFLSLVNAVANGLPLPIGGVHARRSLCFIDNLTSAIALCATDNRAAGEMFHVSDGDDPSVAELARAIGRHLGRPARLVPIPVAMLRFAGRITGRLPQIERLTDSLQVDSTHIRAVLGWAPPVALDTGLAATAAWYRSSTNDQRRR